MSLFSPKPYQVVSMRQGADVTRPNLHMVLRWEIVADGNEIACIVENADDYHCGHGQTPEQAMVDLFGKLGAI